ncbi:winged helix-turn-helix transcriptional regulator [Chitinophaga japonensis]|uniref:HxlR family transcriptional regulator n=1 Tax=Chitinophaga japonensis TaxID=104662 RepID=A0A562SIY9_CHIJA|nr:winged helix-turn-helix transcriptional regulator [Chitinophaga japonensis]TWI80954.1 HxlR family transcriptional regulator [Chitinophaga japonensis]
MYEKKIPKSFECGMAVLMEIIGGKWKSYMVFLIHKGVRRPSELQRAVPSASRRVLNLQLRELEFHGIVKRVIYPEAPPRVEYFLTEFGTSLMPVVTAMDNWGTGYLGAFKALMEKKQAPAPAAAMQ